MVEEKKDSLLLTCLSSGTAGLVGRTICHPIDTLKAKLQINDSPAGLLKVVRTTWQQEGIAGFYRGLGAVMLGGIPGVCLYITTYEASKAALQEQPFIHQHPFWSYLASGMVAEATCCAAFIPVDVVKERLQVQANRPQRAYHYNGSWDALRSIIRQEGLRGIYKGYWATLFSYGPFSAVYFWIFEELKERLRLLRHNKEELSFGDILISSAAAGSVASFITNPLDVAKLRFQVQQSLKAPAAQTAVLSEEVRYNGLFHALRHLYASQGLRGLFRGASARVLFHTPSTAITMACYEESKVLWAKAIPTV